MDSMEANQLSNTLDLTSDTVLPVALPWGHDPETSKWFLYERSNRLRHDPYQNPIADFPAVHYLTAKARNGLRAERISTVYTMPEYPETSHNGVAYCVNTTGLAPELVRQLHLDVQYGKNNRSTSHNQATTSFWLGGVEVQRSTWSCSGVLACQYATDNIHTPHTKWDSSDWERRRKETHHTQRIWQLEYGIDHGQQKTVDFYWACWRDFQTSTRCPATKNCDGVMELGRVENASFTGNPSWAIRCSAGRGTHLYWSHYWAAINPLHNINIEFLQDLIQNGYTGQIQQCYPTFSVKARKKTCGIAHPQGYGQLYKIPCKVKFDFIVPTDLQRTPYVLFCSTGVHSHQPPPPQKTPIELLGGLISVIRRLNSPSLTISQLLISNELRTWLNSLGKRSLSEIHASFASTSRITALIRTEQLLVWGAGMDWAGVVREYQLELPSQKYIQHIYNDGPNAMIICFTEKMAQQLIQRDSFELDMSFKRVAGTFNEVVFAAYDEQFNQLVTYGRVFINSETRVAYFNLFTMFWSQVQRVLPRSQKVHWHHLHLRGIKAIVTDMCSKQASGLGDYLSSIDGEHRPWDWHIQRLLIYCSVHFKRGIDSSIWKETPYADLMKEILMLPSQSEVIDLCDCLRQDQPLISDWLNHKLCPWIISGLNKSYWKGEPNIWDQVRRHSNAVEASHHKSNALGTGLSLLGAIQNDSSRILDKRDWDQVEAQDLYGISRQYRGTSSIERFRHSIRKSMQKRDQRRAEAILQARQDMELDSSILSSQLVLPSTINGPRKRKRTPRSQVSSSGVSGNLSREQTLVVESVSSPFSFGLSPTVSQTRRSL